MRAVLLVLALLVASAEAADKMPELTRVIVSPAVVLSVGDGDTLTIATLGSRAFVGPVRLRAVLAKEADTAGGQKAREHLVLLMPRLTRVRVSQTFSIDGNGTESLCRPVVDVWVEATGKHVNEAQSKFLKANQLWGGVGKKDP